MTVLELQNVAVTYGARRGHVDVAALSCASLAVEQGERIALVGRSAAGKSTIARLAVGLARPSEGTVTVLGQDVSATSRKALRALRRRVHLVFQDPYESLHPSMRVLDLVAEPLAIAGVARALGGRRVLLHALEELGLLPADNFLHRYPGSLSGGQRQRVAIARTLVARPELILADEPASMLDASLRATVVSQIMAVQEKLESTLVFITHDLALARHVANRIVVLREGRIVEDGPTERVLADPDHEETRALLAAARGLRMRH